MENHVEGRKHMEEFWRKKKLECMTIRSIDAVYDLYKEYCKANNITIVINKYIFRTYIRKNGYCNSVTGNLMVKKKSKTYNKISAMINKNSMTESNNT